MFFFQVGTVFGLHGRPYALTSSGVALDASTDPSKLDGTTLTVVRAVDGVSASPTPNINGSACRYTSPD